MMACQHGFARAAHAHCQRQQRQHSRVRRVALQQRLIAAHPGVVIDIARLGHADDRMDQQVGLELAGGAQRQLVVSAVHGVAGLEGDDLRQPRRRTGADLLAGQAQRTKS